MQIPAGESRQGSAERLTDGGSLQPVARQGPASESEVQGMGFCKIILWAVDFRAARVSRFGLRCILGRGHDLARYLAHMLPGIGELALQELRLNLHGLLKVSSVDQFPRMLEGG